MFWACSTVGSYFRRRRRNGAARSGVDLAAAVAVATAQEQQAMPEIQQGRVVETPTEARAGVTGHGVRYVLAFGTLGVIVLFGLVFLYSFA